VLTDFLVKGGESAFAHIFTQNEDMKNAFSRWVMEVTTKQDKGLALNHGGRQVSALKISGLQNCLVKNALGARLSVANGVYILSLPFDTKITLSATEFAPYEAFLTEMCYIVEYAKLHYNDWRKNLVVQHLESFAAVALSEHRDQLLQVLANAIELLKKQLEAVFGQPNVKFMVSKFAQAESNTVPQLSKSHGRILEDADTGDEAEGAKATVASQHHAYTIRLVFAITFLFLIMYVSVYLYRMEVYKDSLIYSRFITSKKDKKSA